MKTTVFFFSCLLLLLLSGACKRTSNDEFKVAQKKTVPALDCYLGKLVKAQCSQFVVEILSIHRTKLTYAPAWKDLLTGSTYANVFHVENNCSFPANINVGDTFSFSLTGGLTSFCVTCEAYVSTPQQSMQIVVGCSMAKF